MESLLSGVCSGTTLVTQILSLALLRYEKELSYSRTFEKFQTHRLQFAALLNSNSEIYLKDVLKMLENNVPCKALQ